MSGVQWALWFVTSSWSEGRSDQRFATKLSGWWAAKRRLISNDSHGVIPRSMLANKPSSFRYLQVLCNGVFDFKIGPKLASNEARKTGQVTVASLGVVSGEASASFERPSRSLFSSDSCQQAIPVYLITRSCNGVFVFKIGHKLASNEARKVGQVTVASLGVVSGEASANSERPSRSYFALDVRQQVISFS